MRYNLNLTARDARLMRIAMSRAIRDTEALIDAHAHGELGSKLKGFSRELRGWRSELAGFHRLATRLRFGAPPPIDPLAGVPSLPITELAKMPASYFQQSKLRGKTR